MSININNLCFELPINFTYALKAIQENGLGIIFFINSKKRLIGSFSDGDARRSILNGEKLPLIIEINSTHYNKNPHYLPYDCNINDIWTLFDKKIKCIPLVDEKMNVVDFSTPNRIRRFSVFEPDIGDKEISNLLECAKSGWISSQGRFINEFEISFSKYLGGGYSVAVSNGTVALELGMLSLGVGCGDEVIVPNFTFAASINSIIRVGAKPVLVDIREDTWTIDYEYIEKFISSKTKAIMPVHIYGQSSHMSEINKIAKKFNLFVIEDAAEALGGVYKKKLIGLNSDCSCFSFFANKLITTGEGGMVVFKSKDIAQKAIILRDHGMSKEKKYWHETAGGNFRMTNMQAGIGVAQLEKINYLYKKRKQIFEYYDANFANNKNIILLPKNSWSENSYWLYTIRLIDFNESARDKLIANLIKRGIDARPGFYPLNQMPAYNMYSKNKEFKISSMIAYQILSLPSSTSLSKDEINHISSIFLEEYNNLCMQLN